MVKGHTVKKDIYIRNSLKKSSTATKTDSVIAVVAPESSSDTFWLIKVTNINCSEIEENQEVYRHSIPVENIFMKGIFLCYRGLNSS